MSENPFNYLQRNAESNPNGVFFRSAHQVMTNADAVVEVKKLAYELRRMGVTAGQIVALDLPDQLSMVFIEAIYHEAAISTVLPEGFLAGESLTIDWLFTSRPTTDAPVTTTVLVDSPFLQRVNQNPYGIRPSDAPVETLRLLFSSGTTGTPKAIALSHEALVPFSDALQTWFEGDPFLVLMDLGTPWGFGGFYLSVEGGLPFLCAGGASQAELVAMADENAVTSLKGSPAQLAAFAAEAESQGRTVPSITSVYFGGTLMPPGVADRVRAVTDSCTIYGMYGATETGVVSSKIYSAEDPSDAGQILPIARVHVVDDNDEIVAVGTRGRIRHQTPGMSTEYVGDPYSSAQSFREGWFYPGDLGLIRPDGGITLTGRESEVLNAGGVKIDPNRLDHRALEFEGVHDACSFDFTAASGLRQIGLAVVTDAGLDLQPLVADLSAAFGAAAPVLIARIDAIPRNAMGKPVRRALSEKFSEA